MRVLVCGSRSWSDKELIRVVISGLVERGATTLIHGGASGADKIAGGFGKELGMEVIDFPADWRLHGKAAGPIRNEKMLREGKPDIVLAFKDGIDDTYMSGGTEHMVKIARANNIKTYIISHA